MTKTIEFVDNEIKFCQLKINKAKEEKVYRETMALLFPENKNINLATVNEIEISLNEYKIKYLQQIKCELEAWEVAKENTFITDGGVIVFQTAIEDDNIYYETIKKALEKYDEN